MSWQTPKTDWAAPDGVRAADMNRIERNILELYNVDTVRQSKIVYVATTGNDTTGNGTSSAPYKTIAKALSSIPKNLNGINVHIHIASGAYSEAVSIKGFSGGSIKLTGNASSIEVYSLTVDGCAVDISSLSILATAAVGFIVTNGGLLMSTGNLSADSSSTSININKCSSVHVSGTLACYSSPYAVNCSGSSRLYAGTITGAGVLEATMGGVITYGTSTLSKYTATGGRVYTGNQSTGLSDASLV